ncbi:hypothetical protein FKM82_013948 [Ascaphus truei]|uniref:nicotinamide N-methyltransferase-like n=1 Tax=Ascaphus truei TaxID=8439 RepID=UPI003F5AA488
MSNFTGAEVYHQEFDPKVFLDRYYQFGSENSWDWYLTFVMKHYCEVFTSGKVKGKTLIDIGTGPTIYQLLSACEAFDEITVSDYADQNREEFEKWLKNEPRAFDWSSTVKYVCELEGDSNKWMEKQEKLRMKCKQYLKCNVLKSNPVDPIILPQGDCIMTSLCLEAACKDHDAYRSALKNITSMLKPGGPLIICGILKNHSYRVGETNFSDLYIEKGFLEEALDEAGFSIDKFDLLKNPKGSGDGREGLEAYFLLAYKMK